MSDTGGLVSELPTGTVTFLFTDIEGSTRLTQALGPAWPPLLERHFALLRPAVAAHGGVEFGSEGDALFAAFDSAPAAVAGAIEAQRALAGEGWPPDATVRVRMGLHTGEGTVSGGSYVGLDVHRAARIAGAAHGGQVLLSGTTQSLTSGALPAGAELLDLGEHRLKDLSRTEHLWQLAADGLTREFPQPRTLNAIPNNLPVQLTSFLGRQNELAEGRRLLADSRLFTLTGPGGTGKTRLALEIAAAETDRFPDGVYFVALGSIDRAELVVPTIAQAVSVSEPGTRPLDRLVEVIGAKSVLLALDNFEQVIEAGAQVTELLARAPKLSVLITSRAPLRVYGEREYPVPPLGLPDLRHLPDLERFSQYESVALFTERAMAVRPDFAVTSANAPAVAEICVRLDGLPLAIELAAARVRVLTPSAILERLGDRLGLLSGGARDLPARQQTLRGAIAWSHDLLNDDERRAFAHLSVFVGGATLEAIESVCFAGPGLQDALDLVTSLVDKSLVRQDSDPGGAPRFRMLSTIREFALEQLRERGEAALLRDRHLGWLCVRVESLAASVFGSDQRETLDSYEREHDNVRAALDWAVGQGRTESALRILAATWRFWQIRGYLAEARKQAERVLALPDLDQFPDRLAAGLEAAGGIAYWQADFAAAHAWYGRALAQARTGGDERAIANALYNLSSAYSTTKGDQDRARADSREALEIYRRLGDEPGIARALWALANTYYFFDDVAGGIAIAEEALELFRRLGDRFMTGWALYMVGAGVLTIDRARTRENLREALPYFLEGDDRSAYGLLFDAFAAYFYGEGDHPRAMRLAGFAAATERSAGTGLAKVTRDATGFTPENLLDDPGLAAAYAEGQRFDLESARRLALEEDGALPAAR